MLQASSLSTLPVPQPTGRGGGTEVQMALPPQTLRDQVVPGESPLRAILGEVIFLSSLDGMGASPRHGVFSYFF